MKLENQKVALKKNNTLNEQALKLKIAIAKVHGKKLTKSEKSAKREEENEMQQFVAFQIKKESRVSSRKKREKTSRTHLVVGNKSDTMPLKSFKSSSRNLGTLTSRIARKQIKSSSISGF